MRILAIGDIHGCFTALQALSDAVPLQPEDSLITLGDYVDRGPDSDKVIEWLIERRNSGQLTALTGNHDQMMSTAIQTGTIVPWVYCGGNTVLKTYGLNPKKPDFGTIPEEHRRFLAEECLPFFETDTHIFVHAGVYPDLPLADQPESILYWERIEDRGPHQSGKTVVCGHTSQVSGWPLDFGHTVCIDTKVYSPGGWLTCLDPLTGDFWQANQRGETRRSHLFEIPDQHG